MVTAINPPFIKDRRVINLLFITIHPFFYGIDKQLLLREFEERPFEVPIADKGPDLVGFSLNHVPRLEDMEPFFRVVLKREFDLLLVANLTRLPRFVSRLQESQDVTAPSDC
jgi:hypothetical protein